MIGPRTVWLTLMLLGALTAFALVLPGPRVPSVNTFFADIGISVGVAPNPDNTLNAQLTQEQITLEEQKADLQAQQDAFNSSTQGQVDTVSSSPLVRYLGIAVIVLTFLVVMNFYFDWRRARNAVDTHGKIGE